MNSFDSSNNSNESEQFIREGYYKPSLKIIDNDLFNECESTQSISQKYHCKKLEQHLFCAYNQKRFPNDGILKAFCEKNKVISLSDSNWHANHDLSDCFRYYSSPIDHFRVRKKMNFILNKIPSLHEKETTKIEFVEEEYLNPTLKEIDDDLFKECESTRNGKYQKDSDCRDLEKYLFCRRNQSKFPGDIDLKIFCDYYVSENEYVYNRLYRKRTFNNKAPIEIFMAQNKF
jgi:hypothetical protein